MSEAVPKSRDRLISAALRQVREGNLSSVTARTICSEARVTAPTLYHYFADISDLYCEVLRHIFEAGLGEHPDEYEDPIAVLNYVWTAQIKMAEQEAGTVDLLNQLLSSGRIPEVMSRTYLRLEAAFEVVSQQRPLRIDHKLAAEIYWAAALGICTLIAAVKHGVPLPSGGADILREAVLDRIFGPDVVRQLWPLGFAS